MGLMVPAAVTAADVIVTCSTGEACSISPANPTLFTVTNAVPGTSVTRSFDIVNNHSQTCGMRLVTDKASTTPENFDEVLFTVIQSDGVNWYGLADENENALDDKSLAVLFREAEGINLGNVPGGQTRAYFWTITLDPAAGNGYQEAKAKFDFDMELSCEEPQVAGTDDSDGGNESGGNVTGSTDGETVDDDGNIAGTTDDTTPGISAPATGRVLGETVREWLKKLPATGTAWDGAIFGMVVLILMLIVMRAGNAIRTAKSK